jgi:hypothetical protein
MEGVETQTRLLQLLLFRSDWISNLFALNPPCSNITLM